MKRLRVLTFVAVLLAWAIPAAFGKVSASPSGETQRLGNSSSAILVTPTPTIPKGTPSPKATVLPPPTKPASEQGAHKVRQVHLGLQSTQAPRQPAGGWQLIYSDGFETGNWPYSPWTVTDLSNDGYDRKWGRSNYFGFWGLWPAAGGAHSVYPPTQYADNMNTRMRYGPFDLRDAKLIALYFWLWRDIESCCDYVVFEVSVDGVNFQELGRWTGYAGWERPVFYLDQYAGRSQVWVAWRFYSDYSITYAGPWVDDVEIWKYVPGQVTARGSFFYADRNNNTVPARFTKVYLYDQDPGGSDDLLATTTTDVNGLFQFPARTNWDDDSTEPDPNARRLDLYVVWETDTNDSATARRRVTNVSNQAYRFYSAIQTNAPDGTADFFNYWIPPGDNQQAAMWIFQDLRRAWEYVRNNTNPQAGPGSVTAKWENGINCYRIAIDICSSFFWPYYPLNGIFIAHVSVNSGDTVVHELAHQHMYSVMGWWYWQPSTWDDFYVCAVQTHGLFDSKTQLCAWTEGWADFFPLAVNSTLNPNDTCYDFGVGPCTGIPDWDHFNLETHNRNDNQAQFPFGDTVEGRVAGALYDLWDNTNEPIYDIAAFGFDPIADIVFQSPHEDTFRKFWDSWKASGQNKHRAVQAIYQNTIDYDTAPRFDPPLPDRVALQNLTMPHVIDLWDYAVDDESTDVELGWQIINVTDPRCGVSLDSHFVNFSPQQGWLGSCDVTLSVSDGIKAYTDTFRVTVVPVRGRSFLPIVLK